MCAVRNLVVFYVGFSSSSPFFPLLQMYLEVIKGEKWFLFRGHVIIPYFVSRVLEIYYLQHIISPLISRLMENSNSDGILEKPCRDILELQKIY